MGESMQKKKQKNKETITDRVFYINKIVDSQGCFKEHIISKPDQTIYGSLQSSLMKICFYLGYKNNDIDKLINKEFYISRILGLLQAIYKRYDRELSVKGPKSIINIYLNDDRFYKIESHIEVLEGLLKTM